jgi:hypothetical protein
MGPEITNVTLEVREFGIGEKLDVEMPADLDQFRRDYSHGTVIGGKRLVKLRHEPANG